MTQDKNPLEDLFPGLFPQDKNPSEKERLLKAAMEAMASGDYKAAARYFEQANRSGDASKEGRK